MESLRKEALHKMYQEKRRQVIGNPLVSAGRGMDYERENRDPRTIKEMTELLKTQFHDRDYIKAAESVARIRILFSQDATQLAFDEMEDSGVIVELIERLGIDMLATNCSIVDNTLQ